MLSQVTWFQMDATEIPGVLNAEILISDSLHCIPARLSESTSHHFCDESGFIFLWIVLFSISYIEMYRPISRDSLLARLREVQGSIIHIVHISETGLHMKSLKWARRRNAVCVSPLNQIPWPFYWYQNSVLWVLCKRSHLAIQILFNQTKMRFGPFDIFLLLHIGNASIQSIGFNRPHIKQFERWTEDVIFGRVLIVWQCYSRRLRIEKYSFWWRGSPQEDPDFVFIFFQVLIPPEENELLEQLPGWNFSSSVGIFDDVAVRPFTFIVETAFKRFLYIWKLDGKQHEWFKWSEWRKPIWGQISLHFRSVFLSVRSSAFKWKPSCWVWNGWFLPTSHCVKVCCLAERQWYHCAIIHRACDRRCRCRCRWIFPAFRVSWAFKQNARSSEFIISFTFSHASTCSTEPHYYSGFDKFPSVSELAHW